MEEFPLHICLSKDPTFLRTKLEIQFQPSTILVPALLWLQRVTTSLRAVWVQLKLEKIQALRLDWPIENNPISKTNKQKQENFSMSGIISLLVVQVSSFLQRLTFPDWLIKRPDPPPPLTFSGLLLYSTALNIRHAMFTTSL